MRPVLDTFGTESYQDASVVIRAMDQIKVSRVKTCDVKADVTSNTNLLAILGVNWISQETLRGELQCKNKSKTFDPSRTSKLRTCICVDK